MKKRKLVFVAIIATFIFSIVTSFSSSILAESKTANMIRIPTITECLSDGRSSVSGMDSCMRVARPEKIDDCLKIPNTVLNYNFALINCYSLATRFNQNACENLIAVEDRDQCYNQANICKYISSQDLRNQCLQGVEQIRKNELIKMFWQIFGIALYFGSLIGIFFVVIKTIIDHFKRKKVSFLKRIGLIILLLLIWFLTSVFSGLPPFEFRIVY